MRDAWRYYWFQAQTDATTGVNGIIYFLRRIPFLGKKIPTKWYRTGALKSLLAILLNFMMLLTKPVITLLMMGLAFLVGNAYNDFIHPLPTAFTLRIMVAVLVYSLGCLMLRGLIFRYAAINIKTIKLGEYAGSGCVGSGYFVDQSDHWRRDWPVSAAFYSGTYHP